MTDGDQRADQRRDRPCVAVCSGKDCRKRAEYRGLRDAIAEVATVVPTRCLDVCASPVVVVTPWAPDPLVFEKLRSPKQHRDLIALVVGRAPGGEPSKRLTERLITGKPRRKALAQLTKQRPRAARP